MAFTSTPGTKFLAGGAWVQVSINNQPVGLATNVTYDEDFQIQPANVLNYLGPIDYDSQGYTCNITLGTFVPEIPGATPINDTQGVAGLHDILSIVTRQTVQDGGGKPGQFDTLTFTNVSSGTILASFRKVLFASNGIQIAPNSYVTANARFVAVERTVS